MRVFATVTSVALAVSSVVHGSPLKARQAPDRFYLETQVVAGTTDCGSNKQGLYVYSYHTGAGLGVATADTGLPSSWFYLNDTQLFFTYPDNEIGPWPVMLEYGSYQAFNPISISIADGPATPGFFVNATGLQSNQTNDGWIVCDWWYQSPQLFSLAGYLSPSLPSSCSKVNLIPVPAV